MKPVWSGLLLADKPPGPTSHQIVDLVRRLTGQRRVGHAGTLDPLASGLLPLVLGPATRLVRFLPHSPKTYSGSLRLGLTTDSDDVTGEATYRHRGSLPGLDEVLRVARDFLGEGMQVPPAVSARKIEGRRMYRLARQGIRVDAPARPVEISRFDLQGGESPETLRFIAEVSGGTYLRALVRDLGRRLGCGAVLADLRRTRIGPMELSAAVTIEPGVEPDRQVCLASLIPPERMPLEPPRLRLSEAEEVRRFRFGEPLRPATDLPPEGLCRVLDPAGRLLGVAERRGDRVFPQVVLTDPIRREP